MRGWDHGAGVDYGRVFGSAQGDAIRNIAGDLGGTESRSPINGAFSRGKYNGGFNGNGGRIYATNFDASRVVPTANENRPKNIALMYIIKHD